MGVPRVAGANGRALDDLALVHHLAWALLIGRPVPDVFIEFLVDHWLKLERFFLCLLLAAEHDIRHHRLCVVKVHEVRWRQLVVEALLWDRTRPRSEVARNMLLLGDVGS